MWKVFAVKTLYRTSVKGEPYSTDSEYSDKFDLIEERIYTVKARSFDEAIKRAEKEAIEYASDPHVNPYGQEVIQKYLGYVNAYEPFDKLPANLEVYSNSFLIVKATSDNLLASNMFGDKVINEQSWRKNFLNSEFSGYVI